MLTKSNLEIVGLASEIVGLAMLLLAAVWQVSVTDWFDAFPVKSQYFIQETANLAALQSLEKIARALKESDADRKGAYLNEVDDITGRAMSRLIGDRIQADHVVKSQGSWLKLVRHSLFVIGAALIILGKAFVLRHKYLSLVRG